MHAAVGAAAAAAVAEAAVWCLPLHYIVSAGREVAVPLGLFLPSFVTAFAVAVAVACRYRSSPQVGAFAAGAGVIAGLVLGRGSVPHIVFLVFVFLLFGIRSVMLAFRDWSEPIATPFLVGGLALLTEAVIATAGPNDWSRPLIVLMPVFFIGSLMSRAVSVWSSDDAEELTREQRDHWRRRSLTSTAWLPVGMLAGVVLGVRGGVLDHLGSFLSPFGDLLVSLLGFLVVQVARPIFWLVDRLGIDPEAVRRAFARIQANAARTRHRTAEHAGGPSLLGRMLGLALCVVAVWALIRVLRRLRPETATAARRSSQTLVTTMSGELPAPPDVASRATRKEPPADRVRRWYGEVLVALAQRGVRKDPSFTPAEFAPEVASAYPECAEAFEMLTRAYEDVRYGSADLSRESLRELNARRRRILALLRRRAPEARDATSPDP